MRLERDWTLDQAAPRLGISRRLLVQIEGSSANPSLSTLLSIAEGFGVVLIDLLEGQERATPFVQPSGRSTLWSTEAGSHADLCVASGPLELWHFTLQPGEERSSTAHAAGSRECLAVSDGAIVVRVGDHEVTVSADDSVAFEADQDHTYRNDTREPAVFTLAVLDPLNG